MTWNLTSDRPIFMQIIEIMQLSIVSGKYAPGDKLPSVRELATEAAVNPNTMQKALQELERSGLVYSKRTSGRFITEDLNMIEEIKSTLAREKIEIFLQGMQSLGFDIEETISLMNQARTAMKGEKA